MTALCKLKTVFFLLHNELFHIVTSFTLCLARPALHTGRPPSLFSRRYCKIVYGSRVPAQNANCWQPFRVKRSRSGTSENRSYTSTVRVRLIGVSGLSSENSQTNAYYSLRFHSYGRLFCTNTVKNSLALDFPYSPLFK